MVIRRVILGLVLFAFIGGVTGCYKPYDATTISEEEMDMEDKGPKKKLPAPGGGTKLNESDW